ncbi:MAG: 2-phospho-L-lactate guanylyltransferase, coenzyme F420 biosynthesis enzyme [Candidatus Methanohalarchaeum thermophilum]|uniref:2-phospho-L-lactate guanylyltransferase, coenzyme F420 biosynthesis enzyme n=1 Tax=Methanohalarchaeum thermophilum TaxID=1903181 RepID=A0A1Q6DTI7_METT1|nr:MAG: 2-phospho-L-lactate guanylyltransferase, coenzyme F420 biosynthesis enzyme [Candidatus Methanohalarchaeum thermophilum]
MLDEVIRTISDLTDVFIVSPDLKRYNGNAKIIKSPKKLNPSLNFAIDKLKLPVLILPSDIPFIEKKDIKKVLKKDKDVILCPGNRGGTNALFLRKKIDLNYDNNSFNNHLKDIKEKDYSYTILDNERIRFDIDELSDLKKAKSLANGKLESFLKNKVGEEIK